MLSHKDKYYKGYIVESSWKSYTFYKGFSAIKIKVNCLFFTSEKVNCLDLIEIYYFYVDCLPPGVDRKNIRTVCQLKNLRFRPEISIKSYSPCKYICKGE